MKEIEAIDAENVRVCHDTMVTRQGWLFHKMHRFKSKWICEVRLHSNTSSTIIAAFDIADVELT